MKKHEMLYLFYKKLPKIYTENIAEYHTHKFIKERSSENELIKEGKYDPSLSNSVIKIRNSVKAGDHLYGDSKESPIGKYDPPLPNSLLEVKSERGKHSTQKPVNLIKWCLKYYSKEGDKVLDPTMGSGSAGVDCKEMNRNFIGIEKDPEIFKLAEERIANFT